MDVNVDRVAQLPWVTRLDWGVACQGFKGTTPLKALHWWGPGKKNPPVGLEQYACKNSARWEFTALESDVPEMTAARSGYYCWRHLVNHCLYATPREMARTVELLNLLNSKDTP